MSTHVLGFQSYFRVFFASFCIGKISNQKHKGYPIWFSHLVIWTQLLNSSWWSTQDVKTINFKSSICGSHWVLLGIKSSLTVSLPASLPYPFPQINPTDQNAPIYSHNTAHTISLFPLLAIIAHCYIPHSPWISIAASWTLQEDSDLQLLTLPMLRLLSSKTQGRKAFWKPSKPYWVGTHSIALAEHSQMSTRLPGFQSFFRFFAACFHAQISHQQCKG